MTVIKQSLLNKRFPEIAEKMQRDCAKISRDRLNEWLDEMRILIPQLLISPDNLDCSYLQLHPLFQKSPDEPSYSFHQDVAIEAYDRYLRFYTSLQDYEDIEKKPILSLKRPWKKATINLSKLVDLNVPKLVRMMVEEKLFDDYELEQRRVNHAFSRGDKPIYDNVAIFRRREEEVQEELEPYLEKALEIQSKKFFGKNKDLIIDPKEISGKYERQELKLNSKDSRNYGHNYFIYTPEIRLSFPKAYLDDARRERIHRIGELIFSPEVIRPTSLLKETLEKYIYYIERTKYLPQI